MRALLHDRYGDADLLELREVPDPAGVVADGDAVADGDVVIRIEAASINMADWHMMTGTPRMMRLVVGLRRPPRPIPGTDIAGTVVAVGAGVTRLAVGDEVFGQTEGGALAEYVAVSADRIIQRPVVAGTGGARVGADEAACLGVAAVTALQGLRDKAQVRPGEHVLIIGASGGVGTFAVQLAKHFGATVTAVCSTHNVEQARELGADHVVDYRRDDLVALARDSNTRYDVIFDNPGNRRLGELRSIMQPTGRYLMVGGPKGGWIQPMPRLLAGAIGWRFVEQEFISFTAAETRADLLVLRELYEAGALRSVISDRYGLDDAAAAIRQQGEGHARAKIVVTVEGAGRRSTVDPP